MADSRFSAYLMRQFMAPHQSCGAVLSFSPSVRGRSYWVCLGFPNSGYSLRLVISILFPAAGALYPRDSFRKSVRSLCLYRRLEVCGDVPGIFDAHRLCPTNATLRGQSRWLLFWCCGQVIMIFFSYCKASASWSCSTEWH
jgi:hypothetical protein